MRRDYGLGGCRQPFFPKRGFRRAGHIDRPLSTANPLKGGNIRRFALMSGTSDCALRHPAAIPRAPGLAVADRIEAAEQMALRSDTDFSAIARARLQPAIQAFFGARDEMRLDCPAG